jgi:hypothetical protein
MYWPGHLYCPRSTDTVTVATDTTPFFQIENADESHLARTEPKYRFIACYQWIVSPQRTHGWATLERDAFSAVRPATPAKGGGVVLPACALMASSQAAGRAGTPCKHGRLGPQTLCAVLQNHIGHSRIMPRLHAVCRDLKCPSSTFAFSSGPEA